MTERGRLPGQRPSRTDTRADSPAAPGQVPQPLLVLREMPCPYLPGRMERKVITNLNVPDAALVHSQLSRGGFRRSHGFAYRPACRGCDACVPVRVVAQGYAPSKSLRRNARRNADLTVTPRPARATDEYYALFARYIQARHGDGEMREMRAADFRQMIEESPVPSAIAEMRDAAGVLRAAMLYDMTDDGASAVYTFFDPEAAARSLGTFAVHWLIEETRRRGGDYVYLGYWIADSRKMAYKSRFQPLQALRAGQWQPLADATRRQP